MKMRATDEGLGMPAIIAAVLLVNTLVKITGNRTVNAAAAGDVVIGRLAKPSKTAGGSGTVETRAKEFIEIKTSEAVVAGDRVKMAAPDGSGEQQVAKFVVGTDAPDLLLGYVWNGGALGATVEVLMLG